MRVLRTFVGNLRREDAFVVELLHNPVRRDCQHEGAENARDRSGVARRARGPGASKRMVLIATPHASARGAAPMPAIAATITM